MSTWWRVTRTSRTPRAVAAVALLAGGITLGASRSAHAQDASTPDATPASDAGDGDASTAPDAAATPPPPCPASAAGCARAPIAFHRRDGLPIEFDVDTGWVPSGSPVQVRFRTALQGHTDVRAQGWLEGSWPEPMTLRAHGMPGTGVLDADYGIVLDARIRLHLDTGATTYDWEGSVPYVPMIDFRAHATTVFDPWSWDDDVTARGSTPRSAIAFVSLTSGLIPIPGISGGLSFEAQADLTTTYHSTRMTFGAASMDAISSRNDRVMAYFTAGPQAEYFPQLEGHVGYTGTVRIYPGLYVSLVGHRWTIPLVEIPVPIGPIDADWQFPPADAVLQLPDVSVARDLVVDFGNVTVGTRATNGVPFESVGMVDLDVSSPAAPVGPFAFPRASATIAPRTMVTLPVEFAPTEPGAVEQRAVFRTSDPDTPVVYVTLRGTGVVAMVDAGVEAGADAAGDAAGDASGDARDGGRPAGMNGGCGCRTSGSGESERGLGAWLVALGAVVALRERRVRARGRRAAS